MAGDKGLSTGEEKQEAEHRLQTQPQACGEINTLSCVLPSLRYRPRPCRPRLTRRRHVAAPSRATAPLPPHAPPRPGTRHHAMRGGERNGVLCFGSLSSTAAHCDNRETVNEAGESGAGEAARGERAAAESPGYGEKRTPPGWREWYGPPGGPRGRPLAGMWAALIGQEALKGPRRESARGLRPCQVLLCRAVPCYAIPYPTPVFSRVQLCGAVPRRGVVCLTVPRCLALCHALPAVSH